MSIALPNVAAAVQSRIMQMGAVRATMALTLLAVLASVALTWLCLFVLGVTDVPLHTWLVAAIVVPLGVSSIMFGAIVSMAYQLAEAKAELAEAATTDSLTGIANRRRFMERARQVLDQACVAAQPASLLLLDVDHFKTINDRYGHGLGDAVLVEMARRCSAVLGDDRLFARLGGEEFVALVSGPDAGAAALAERLRDEIARLDLDGSGAPLGVTVSIGIAGSGFVGTGLEGMLMEADRQLYVAKDAGRNRVAGAVLAA